MSARGFFQAIVLALALLATTGLARAQVQPLERPFAEHHVAIQLSDASDEKQHLVLNNVENLMKAFGPDKIQIEVVAFGPGLDLLRADNPNAEHIRSLVTQGARFDACQNTIDTWERNNGHPFPLMPVAQRVPSGMAQIIYLVEHGFINIRP